MKKIAIIAVCSIVTFATMAETRQEELARMKAKAAEVTSGSLQMVKDIWNSDRTQAIFETSGTALSGFREGVDPQDSLCSRMERNYGYVTSNKWFSLETWQFVSKQARAGDYQALELIEGWKFFSKEFSPNLGKINEETQYDETGFRFYKTPSVDEFSQAMFSFWQQKQTKGRATYRCFEDNLTAVRFDDLIESTAVFMVNNGYESWANDFNQMIYNLPN